MLIVSQEGGTSTLRFDHVHNGLKEKFNSVHLGRET